MGVFSSPHDGEAVPEGVHMHSSGKNANGRLRFSSSPRDGEAVLEGVHMYVWYHNKKDANGRSRVFSSLTA